MRTIVKIGLQLAFLSLFLGGCCADRHACSTAGVDNGKAKIVHLTANVDGSGKFVFTKYAVYYQHFNWQPPTEVTLDGEPWEHLDQTPAGWVDDSKGLNLRQARIVKREGRDVIALEQTPEGFDLYLCDSPGGADLYDVTIAIPRR